MLVNPSIFSNYNIGLSPSIFEIWTKTLECLNSVEIEEIFLWKSVDLFGDINRLIVFSNTEHQEIKMVFGSLPSQQIKYFGYFNIANLLTLSWVTKTDLNIHKV